MSKFEGEVVVYVCGRRVRFYLGHTGNERRWRMWHTSTSRGMYVRPWGERAIGVQWRWP